MNGPKMTGGERAEGKFLPNIGWATPPTQGEIMTTTDPTRRFSSRVQDYIKYRPSYPRAILDTLKHDCQLNETSHIADIGAGTGILAELFLNNGNSVAAVEPNPEMRVAGENRLHHHAHFQSIPGTAEATLLPAASVDFVTAGQAFHWFDRRKAKAEFLRILRPSGWVMLVWNERQTTSPFLVAYEQLLQTYAPDYAHVNHKQIDRQIVEDFYAPQRFHEQTFPNHQDFDWEGVKGRLLSSSYTPEAGQPQHDAMLAELSHIYQSHQINGQVRFEYLTVMYYGRLH